MSKLHQNSLSIHRILGEPNCNNRRQRVALQTVESSFDQNPPEYSTIISSDLASTSNHERMEPSTNTNENERRTPSEVIRQHITNARRHTTTNFPSQKSLEKMDSFSLTMPRRQINTNSSIPNDRLNFRNLTAHDVAQLLRSTQNTQRNELDTHYLDARDDTIDSSDIIDSSTFPIHSDCVIDNDRSEIGQEDYSLTRSIEELILNEVPVGESSAAATFCERDDIELNNEFIAK